MTRTNKGFVITDSFVHGYIRNKMKGRQPSLLDVQPVLGDDTVFNLWM